MTPADEQPSVPRRPRDASPPSGRGPRAAGPRGATAGAGSPALRALFAVAAAVAFGIPTSAAPATAGPTTAPAPAARAQEAAPADTSEVARARELAASGRHAEAADLLAGYLAEHPDRARVRWLYARTLYWSGRRDAAREAYERALSALPEVPALRVDYGRFLVETGAPGRAEEVLAPAVVQARAAGEPAARAEARRLLARAARATAPWVALGADYADDIQPLRDAGLELKAGVPLSPHAAVIARGRGRQLDAGGGDWRRVAGGELALALDPEGPVRLSAAAGRLHHDGGGRTDWTGEAGLAADLGAGLTLSGRGERWNYRHTRLALDTAVFVETASARLRRERPAGWGGEVGARVDRFPGGNTVRSAHLWALAPVWSQGGEALRIGYAFRAADAEESTFRPAATDGGGGGAPGGPGGPGGPGTGRPGGPPFGPPTGGPGADRGGVYDPYYTPEEDLAHSAVAALLLRPSGAVTLALDGAVGIHATERAPRATDGAGGGATVEFVDRDYTPWRLRGRLRADPSPSDALELAAGYREDAFFQAFEASLRWTHWFTGAVPGP